MKRFTVLLPFALLACTSSETKICEDFVKGSLEAPSTYKRVSVEVWDEPYSVPKDGYSLRFVAITYDADNLFGVPVRQGDICAFELKNGKPYGDIILQSIANASRPGSGKTYDCCLTDL